MLLADEMTNSGISSTQYCKSESSLVLSRCLCSCIWCFQKGLDLDYTAKTLHLFYVLVYTVEVMFKSKIRDLFALYTQSKLEFTVLVLAIL
jgi:hypothetical protein